MKKENLKKTNLVKRMISVVLSLTIGLGTFISMMAENVTLLDILNIKNAFTAYASQNDVPHMLYDENRVILYKYDYTIQDDIYYRIGDNTNLWKKYEKPLEIPAYQQTNVYARYGADGTISGRSFETPNTAIGEYIEYGNDFDINCGTLSFNLTRWYKNNSDWILYYCNHWFESQNNVLSTELPDGRVMKYIKTGQNEYTNFIHNLTATKNGDVYTFNTENYRIIFDDSDYTIIAEDNYGNEIESTYDDLTSTSTIVFNGITYYMQEVNETDTNGHIGYKVYGPYKGNNNNYSSDSCIKYYVGNGNRITKVVDRTGVTISEYLYDDNHRIIKSNDKSIQYYNTEDNRNGRVASIVYDSGEGVVYIYDDANKTYTVKNTLGDTISITEYNDVFLPVSYTDENGTTTTYSYEDGMLTDSTYGNEETESYNYNDDGKIVRVSNSDGYSYYVYDNSGKLVKTAKLPNNYENAPDEFDDTILTYEDVLVYNYNSGDLITSITGEDYSETYEYSILNWLTKVTTTTVENNETNTSITTYGYDNKGNIISKNIDGEITTYTYDNAGRTLLVNEAGKCTRTLYDNQGRIIQEIGPEDYDSTCEGLPSANTYSNSNVGQRYTYNNANQVVSETNRLGVQTTYTYHTNGTKATETFDTYKYEYNNLGNIEYVKIKASANSSNYINYAHYIYDNNNRNTSIEYGNGQTVNYTYDNNGNLTAQSFKENPNAQQVTQFEYTYNEDNKLTQKLDYENDRKTVYASDGTVTVYRGTGNSPTLLYTYKDSTTTETVNSEEVTTRTYEQGFAQYVEPSQNGHTYNATSITSETTGNVSTFDINNTEYTMTDTETDGQLTERVFNKTSSQNDFNDCEYTYDNDGNVTQIEYPNITVQYTYDNDGRIETKSTSGSVTNNQHFYYDSKGQIIRCDDSRRNQSITYEYDNRGNMTQRNFYAYTTGEITENTNTTAETEYDFDYDDNVWIDAVEFSTDNVLYNDNYVYDENGNPLNIDYQEFEWTNGRQLKSITYHFIDGTSAKALEYTYDENGLRTSKDYGSYKYDYIYDGDKLIAELKTNPNNGNYIDRREFFYDGNDEVIGFTRRNGQDTYFYLKDAEGNIIGFTDGNGTVKALYDYDAWGKMSHINSVSWENPLTYRGYYYDDENMMFYLQSRYYNPQWGRFLNADLPEIAQLFKDDINGLNLFAYCCNEPINNSDSSGYANISKDIRTLITKLIKKLAERPTNISLKGYKGATKKRLNSVQASFNTNNSKRTIDIEWGNKKNWKNYIERLYKKSKNNADIGSSMIDNDTPYESHDVFVAFVNSFVRFLVGVLYGMFSGVEQMETSQHQSHFNSLWCNGKNENLLMFYVTGYYNGYYAMSNSGGGFRRV